MLIRLPGSPVGFGSRRLAQGATGEYFRLLEVIGPLPESQPAPIPIPDRAVLSRFYPDPILDQTHTGEFRYIVNLFINLPTIRDEIQLAAFMQTVFDLLTRYGGFFDKLDFGDKGSNALLLWGAPVSYENDIDRALNFILDLQASTSIPVNAGITYYIAHAGFIGSAYLEDYTGYGRGVNLAARFLTRAARGEIWVSEAVMKRARGGFEFDDLGEIRFKGFSDPQHVYQLVDRSIARQDIFGGALIGRQAEMARLEAFYQPLCAGQYAGALVIFGEAGLGKSRLAFEFRNAAICTASEPLWALCQADEILREPLNPLIYWLKDYFSQADSQPEARNKRNFNRVIDELIEKIKPLDSALAQELDRLRSFLAALVGLNWSDSLYAHLDPQGRYDSTLNSLAVLFQAECTQRPVLLLLEDAQWLDPLTAEFLPRLARTLQADPAKNYPLAILATARPEAPPEVLGAGLSYQEIRLQGMAAAEVLAMTSARLSAPPSPELLQLLLERSEGNPFYVEQILRYLQEEDRLSLQQGVWALGDGGDQAPLPADVGAILVARLDRLAVQVRSVVLTAAVLGREFEVQILAHILQNGARLSENISTAAAASIWTPLGELRCIFNHILMQDAAYHMLLLTQRQSLHALAVQAMESLYQDDLASHSGELAYHAEHAGLFEKACLYLTQAGEIAQAKYQNQQAVKFYTRALELTPPEALSARTHLLLHREELYTLLAEYELQRADLETLSVLAGELEQSGADETAPGSHRAQVLERWAGYALDTGDYPTAGSAAEQAAALSQAARLWKSAVKAFLIWASALVHQGKYELAKDCSRKSLELAIQDGNPSGQGRSLNMLGMIYWETNDLESASQYLTSSLQIGAASGDQRLQSMASNNLANVMASRGDYAAARDYYHEAVRLTREIGDRSKEGLSLGNLGWITGMLGDYPAAQAYAEQNLSISRQIGDPNSEVMALVNLSAYSGRGSQPSAALEYARRALSQSAALDNPSLAAWALTYLGHAQLSLGEIEPARESYRQALEIRRSLDQPHLAPELLAGLARAAQAESTPASDAVPARILAEAMGYVNEILAYQPDDPSLGACDEPLRVFLTCWQVLHAAADPRAQGILDYSYELLQEQAARISDDAVRQGFPGERPLSS